jgi:hypothetical protein
MKIKPETMWAIWNPSVGFYFGTWSQRKEAQTLHAAKTNCSWRYRYMRGDRAVRVVISPVKATKREQSKRAG